MPRNCCGSATLLLTVFLLTTRTTPLQHRIVVEDYDYNGYQNDNNGYQNGYNEPQNGYNEPQNGYNQPQNGYNEPQDGYNQPQNDYNQSQNGYNQPQNGYNEPQNDDNLPQNGYNQPQNGYSQPQNGYSQPQNGYNDRQNGYSERQNGYNEPQNGYNQPQNSYNERQNSYNEYQNFQPVAKFDKPIVVKALEKSKNQQDFSKIPGIPGVDFPLYHTVPPTSFSCAYVPYVPGMYANVETGCQAYHICHDGREGHQGASFLCTNGTLFNQQNFACDWWYNVNCADAPSLYRCCFFARRTFKCEGGARLISNEICPVKFERTIFYVAVITLLLHCLEFSER